MTNPDEEKNSLLQEEPAYLVIPAAGLGTRMYSVNPGVPKEMLPVGNKPAIHFSVAEGLSAGIKNIIIIISRNKETVRRYFEDRSFRKKKFPLAHGEAERIIRECSITFLYQEEPLGESDAIYLARESVGNRPLAVIYPDNIYFPSPGVLCALIPVFMRYKTDVVALMEVTRENARGISNSGRVDTELIKDNIYRITRIIPKSEGHFIPRSDREIRACGFTVSGPHLFRYSEKAGAINKDREFTDVPVRTLILREKGIIGCLLPGAFFDIGNPAGYKDCLEYVKSLSK